MTSAMTTATAYAPCIDAPSGRPTDQSNASSPGYALKFRPNRNAMNPSKMLPGASVVLTDSGVLAGWRRFWPVLRGELAQFGVYVVVHFLLLLAISIGQTILAAIIFGIIGTVGALVGLVVVLGVFGGLHAALASTAGVVALVVIALLTVLVATVCYLPVKIVVLTYVFSYELSVLGAADEKLRLLPVDDNTETTANPT